MQSDGRITQLQRDEVIHSERIRRLEELTRKLTGMPTGRPLPGVVEYDVTGGVAFGFSCLDERDINVQRSVLSKGVHFPKHVHECNEWLIVYSGRIEAHVNGTNKKIGKAEFVMIPADTPHSIDVLEDTRLLGVTIPPDPAYPTGE